MRSAPPNDITFQARSAIDRRTPIDPTGNIHHCSSSQKMSRISYAPFLLAHHVDRGLNAAAPHRLTRLLAGDSDCRLLAAIANLVNLVIAGKLDSEINTILYGGKMEVDDSI